MARVEKPKSGSLAADMRMLLETADDADLALQTFYYCLPVHRAVLCARSPVFAAMFRYDMKESREAIVNTVDVGEVVLRKLLHFVYTDEVPPLEAVAADLLVAADKYQLVSLKDSCEKWLTEELNIENAAAVAVFAVTHSCDWLKTSVINFISTHYVRVIGTRGWEEALRHNADASVEICKLISAEVLKRNSFTWRQQSSRAPSTRSEFLLENLQMGRQVKRERKKFMAPVPTQIQKEGSLASDLGKLLISGQAADITLVVRGSKLRAHRFILSARSSVFAAMLENVSNGILDIRDDTPEVLQQILHFVYTDEGPCSAGTAGQLLAAAVKYDLPVLVTLCEEKLTKDLTIENASAVAAIALTHVCPSLRKTLLNFIRHNLVKVIGTAGWAQLLWDNPRTAVTICQFAADPSMESRIETDAQRSIGLKVKLRDAAKRGDTSEVLCLVAAGAEVDAPDTLWRRTALHWAAAKGQREVVRCLLRRGAAVDAEDCRERTPLHLAACHGDSGSVQLLLAAGAEPNSRDDTGATPLHCAALYDNVEALRALLQAGADVSIRDGRQHIAFAVAYHYCSLQAIDMFKKHYRL